MTRHSFRALVLSALSGSLTLAACGGGGGGGGGPPPVDPVLSSFMLTPPFGTSADGLGVVVAKLVLADAKGRPLAGRRVQLEATGFANALVQPADTDGGGATWGALRTTVGGIDRIGEGWVGFAIFMCLYSESSWPTLNSGLREAKAGRGDVLLKKATQVVSREPSGEYGADSYLHAMLPVRCADWPRETANADLLAARRKAQSQHRLWARLTGELYDSCRAWPAPGRTPKTGPLAVGAAPILVIGNLRDPATPIGGTKQLATDLSSGILVTSDHDGHGTYYAGNSCVDAIVDKYLIEGITPSSDKAC